MAIQGSPLGGERTSVGAVAAQRTQDRLKNWDPAGQFVLVPLADVLVFADGRLHPSSPPGGTGPAHG